MVMAFSRKRPPFSWGKVVFDQQWRIVLLSLGYFITTAQALPFFLLMYEIFLTIVFLMIRFGVAISAV